MPLDRERERGIRALVKSFPFRLLRSTWATFSGFTVCIAVCAHVRNARSGMVTNMEHSLIRRDMRVERENYIPVYAAGRIVSLFPACGWIRNTRLVSLLLGILYIRNTRVENSSSKIFSKFIISGDE